MILYGFYFGNFTLVSSNLTELVSQNATDSINNATATATAMTINATQVFLDAVRDFAVKVASDNIESCFHYAQDAGNLQYEILSAMENCTKMIEQVNQQMFVNISVTFTGWVQTINYFSNCHDKCVGRYCPFIPFGSHLASCWMLKRIWPSIYNTIAYSDGYKQCHTEVRFIL
jgi:hypothetical protein